MRLPAITPTLPLVGYALAVGLAMGSLAGWRITAWVNQGRELKAVHAAQAADKAAYDRIILDLQIQAQKSQEASRATEAELASLRAQPRDPRPVRLCRDAPRPAVSTAPSSTPGHDAAATGAGPLPQGDGQGDREGPDISADLYAIADEADELLARCRGLQRFVTR